MNQLGVRRRELGMTQMDLAHRMRVSPSTISTWETGTHKPTRLYMDRLAKVLKVPVSQVVQWTRGE